tara:strand:- start:1049 stop:2200 length:1152 start_codon:yes stop_codon:yes gene_type:complete
LTFFNKKEEVLDVQLTQLGKYLLSKGKLKPSFYAFSDDEILYDPSYAGIENKETAKEASNRIQKDTQRLRTLYEHDGVETRIKSLNGHEVEKVRGFGWQARIKNRTEEMPFNQAYGIDTFTDEKMGADDRNLVRNMLGNSKIGEQRSPSWRIDSLYNGMIESINVSSSSPNVGIKRPVLNLEVDYDIVGEYVSPTEVDPATLDGFYLEVGPDGQLAQWEFDMDSPLPRSILFVDSVKASVPNSPVVLSIIEDNVQFDLENFEYEFYEIEKVELNERANNAPVERLRRLSNFSPIAGPFGSDDPALVPNKKSIEHYFTVGSDDTLESVFGTDLNGANPFKRLLAIQGDINSTINAAEEYAEIARNPEAAAISSELSNAEGECED